MNWVKSNIDKLKEQNYVRKAASKTDYWIDFSLSRVNYYKNLFGDKFNVIIYGDVNVETDFYVIPYAYLKGVLIENNLSDSKNRERWIGNVIHHRLILTRSGIKLDISDFYSIPITEKSNEFSSDLENDYSIENSKREIAIRLKQSKFRSDVLSNFEEKCCLTGISESNLLIASHIVPWSHNIALRLNPGNGLCLSVHYDKLFDQGYFTLNDLLQVRVSNNLDLLSSETKRLLNEISSKFINPPIQYQILIRALEYHRQNIFDKWVSK